MSVLREGREEMGERRKGQLLERCRIVIDNQRVDISAMGSVDWIANEGVVGVAKRLVVAAVAAATATAMGLVRD